MNPLNLVQDIDDTCNADCHTLEYPELCKNVLTDLYNFKILTFNIRSIQQNFNSFLISLSRTSLKFDVLILTECWIDKNSVIGVVDGYNCYRTERFINRAGGVVAFVKSELNPIVSEPLLNDANSLYIDIPNCLSILGIYRSPSITDVSLDVLGTKINYTFSNRLLKMTKQYISKPLTHIFNLSLSTGQFPNNWKTASVTPLASFHQLAEIIIKC
ncbi:hypothetical protein ABMA27_013561 [Loxostege sticticalis]|uniref:Uncharacterized protein n=1 Tax=Loxostege sticticalis TaxID=481309 RepID=A0ABR3IFS1_LOXSC